jgi:TPR repeat protein
VNDAHTAWEMGDVRTAFRLFREMAEAGDFHSYLNLGYFYDVGLGTSKSRTVALRWYRRAYRAGDSAGASNIATVYRDQGRHRAAFDWLRRAAAMNDGDAELEVAKCYLAGLGVARHRGHALAAIKRALASRSITEASREEAAHLSRQIRGGK